MNKQWYILGAFAALGGAFLWFTRKFDLNGVTNRATTLFSAPAGTSTPVGKVPEGIVVAISEKHGSWYKASFAPSISDVLFNRRAVVNGWLPIESVSELVKDKTQDGL